MAAAANGPRLVKAVNGVGAFIPSCRKLVFHYCEQSGSSAPLRSFLISRLSPFAAQHPYIEFLVTPRPAKHPCIRAFYLNGTTRVESVKNMDEKELEKVLKRLSEADGRKVEDLRKVRVRSTNESVRGVWSPFKQPLKI